MEERDEQVRRMQDIYANAMNVIVWLGGFEEPQDSNRHIGMENWGIDRLDPCTQDKAREALDLADHLRRYWDYLSSSPTDLMQAPSYEQQKLQDRRIWAQLSRIFYRPWFERLWVIQELGLAKRPLALWGNLLFPWENLRDGALFMLRPSFM